ncbi:sugar ABC transporter permease [Faecalicatena contorta]|uniref:carbohydrate ABC transporter permease n=1 Tax=Faecalicatena contorta TaxID=39482 RepID=UPI002EBBBF32|nr:sugar ABC transporter permease [Muricomes sp.]
MTGKRKQKKNIFAVLFSFPALLIYTLFMIVPLFYAVYISTMEWTGAGNMKFIGIENYRFLFSFPDFWKIIGNTGILILLHLLIQIPVAILLAFLLLRTKRGFRFFRLVYFMPTVISATVMGLMFSILLNSDIGPVNVILHSLGMDWAVKNWLTDPKIVIFSVSLVLVWQYIGYHMSVILAGMQSLSKEIIESATIDGANSWQLCMRIVLPQIKDVLQVSVLFCVTGCLKAFEHSFIMTWGGPGVNSTYLAVYMYKSAFFNSELGKSSAISVVIVACALVLYKICTMVFSSKEE